MTETRRTMPIAHRIRAYWAERLIELGKFDSVAEAMEPGHCFACGFSWSSGPATTEQGLERAHIVARVNGGPDDMSNLHLLCRDCHYASEPFEGEGYWMWFAARTALARIVQMAAADGRLDVAALFGGRSL